ncbi:hypothetical protein G7Y89_g8407 [Cudoniella acicularis]|uniref:Uncharacterized protein n=1 Tax=Cudoniella acicularis TaxID=354080 RepID=A0A8H4RIY2_9HELO|nr:hypothetical protein G7Y89_g8407 [Cudoniella acicularis]
MGKVILNSEFPGFAWRKNPDPTTQVTQNGSYLAVGRPPQIQNEIVQRRGIESEGKSLLPINVETRFNEVIGKLLKRHIPIQDIPASGLSLYAPSSSSPTSSPVPSAAASTTQAASETATPLEQKSSQLLHHPHKSATTISSNRTSSPTSSSAATSSIPSSTADADARGECPQGQILDPAEGGQNATTPNPVCIPDTQCPQGEIPGTMVISGTTRPCLLDPKDLKKPKCDATDYYTDVMANSTNNAVAAFQCRKTRKKAAADQAANDQKSEDEKAAAEKAKADQQEKMTARNKLCLAFVGSSGLLDQPPNMDDITSVADNWPVDVNYVEGNLTNSNVQPPMPHAVVVVDSSMAGSGNPGVALFEGIINAFKKAPKDETGKAASDATNAAEKTTLIQKIRSNKAYKDCLLAIGTSVANSVLHVGSEVPPEGFPVQVAPPSDPTAEITTPSVTIWGGTTGADNDKNFMWITHADNYFWPDRWLPNKCQSTAPLLKVGIQVKVTGVCCTFYSDEQCTASLLSTSGNEVLSGNNKDAIQSWYCQEGSSCNGNPHM